MRIISGRFRSRVINTVLDPLTRPTTDKVRGAIFNIIGQYFDGGIALDLFAGSGSMGLEAISRGIEKCYFVDKSDEAIKVIKQNIKLLKLENDSFVIKNDYLKALEGFKNAFDLIFLDPPYKMDIIEDIMAIIHEKGLLKPNGLIICEYAKEKSVDSQYFTKIKENIYSIRKVSIFRGDENA